MNVAFLLVGLCVLLTVLVQVILRSTVLGLGELQVNTVSAFIDSCFMLMKEPAVWVVIAVQGLVFVLWSAALSRIPASTVFSLFAASFILMPMADKLFFSEEIPLQRWAGIAVVALGVVVVARS